MPLAGLPVTVYTVPSVKPSRSVATSVPLIVVSSSPLPLVPLTITVGSFTAFTVTVTVAVSVTPPDVTVYV